MYNQLSLEEKKMMVRQKFKNGKDLHTYLNEHCKFPKLVKYLLFYI